MADERIGVLGAGSWGTALAIDFARHRPVSLWSHSSEEVAALRRERENRQYLPGIPFPEALALEDDLGRLLQDCGEVLIVVPSHAFAGLCARIAELAPGLSSLSWATKGFEPESGRLLSEVAAHYFPQATLGVLSGPTFAREVAQGLPTAITIASTDPAHARRLADWMRSDHFRVYTSGDLVGVQVGGAAKNVMAIAAGISDGLGFGANARAALITRGLSEITRLGLALGGRAETFMGLAGLGDLVLTCTDDQSRNRRLGLALAVGQSVDQARAAIGQEVEGVGTAREVRRKAQELGIEMPITEQTWRVLYQGLPPREAVHNLLSRQPRAEEVFP